MPHSKKQEYLKKISNPFVYFFFMFWRLPSLIFWGVKLLELNYTNCVTVMRQRWTNQNPFQSIYFSALNGAAELSTGLLFQLHLQELDKFSMLVVSSTAQFKKKAKGKIKFTCSDGIEIQRQISDLKKANDAFTFMVTSIATDENLNEIGIFEFTWSVKRIS